jgi:hypothetical protein
MEKPKTLEELTKELKVAQLVVTKLFIEISKITHYGKVDKSGN